MRSYQGRKNNRGAKDVVEAIDALEQKADKEITRSSPLRDPVPPSRLMVAPEPDCSTGCFDQEEQSLESWFPACDPLVVRTIIPTAP